jgi:hypothetical protein
MEKELAKELDKYIREKHTQEECSGFIDGFTLGYQIAKEDNPILKALKRSLTKKQK